MTLRESVIRALMPGGALDGRLAGFRARDAQVTMASAIADTVTASGVLVVEAGTGVGKTFAYLVPALLSGERVLISTASKALQDQLYARDIPRVLEALGLTVRRALLKGRSSYLCTYRLASARHGGKALSPQALAQVARVERWAQQTRNGDISELGGLDDGAAVLPLVTSTRENCLGSNCPDWRTCHVNQARREAMAADLVVINHHLFFADIEVRESGVAELLPMTRVVIFDEAHRLNDIGVQFLGRTLSATQFTDFARDLLGAGLTHARGLQAWDEIAGELETAAREVRLAAGAVTVDTRMRWSGVEPEGVDAAYWNATMQRLQLALEQVARAVDTVSELAPDFVRLAERVADLCDGVKAFSQPAEEGVVRWLEVARRGSTPMRMVESPLDIAEGFGAVVLPDAANTVASRAWVFTSATLGTDESLSWFTESCGLQSANVLRVLSPFDYASQAHWYVPRELPMPGDSDHSTALADWTVPAIKALGGRTLVLTTTLRALRVIGARLQEALADSGIEVLMQGQLGKLELMNRFRAQDDRHAAGCVLVASATFWEGFDVPGRALQLVVIDKLPFPPPGDPLVEARCQRLEVAGRSAFGHYMVPEAAIALKQGAGRLIRHETDCGLLVVGDTRLMSKPYGRRIVAALPPMTRTVTPQEWQTALDALINADDESPEFPPGLGSGGAVAGQIGA